VVAYLYLLGFQKCKCQWNFYSFPLCLQVNLSCLYFQIKEYKNAPGPAADIAALRRDRAAAMAAVMEVVDEIQMEITELMDP